MLEGEETINETSASCGRLTLNGLIEELRQTQRVCFVHNAGNAGDALIALGTYHFFDRHRLSFPTAIPQSERERIQEFDLVLFSGGGNLVPYYQDGIEFLKYAARLGKQIVVLPHTTFGIEAVLRELAGNLRLFTREKSSFDRLMAAGFPLERLGLEEDMAFWIDQSFFSRVKRETLRKTAYCLRTDAESSRSFSPLPHGNIDISCSWIGDLWHDRQFTEAVVNSLAAYLSQFERVVTDRLHVAILASMLHLDVRLYPNAYYKNKAIFNKSLKDRFSRIEFVDRDSVTSEDGIGSEKPSSLSHFSPRASAPLISAIICSHNRHDLLHASINSLLAQEIEQGSMEIIIVDNSSDRECAEASARQYAELDKIRYIYEPTPGLSNARNVGLRLASAPIVAYIDDDATAAPNWAREILAAYEDMGDEAAVVGGRVRPIWLEPRPKWLTKKLESFFSIIDRGDKRRELCPGEWLAGCNLSFRRESLLSVGGFSTDLGRRGTLSLLSNEEGHVVDLIRGNGGKVVYEPNAVVDHHIDASRTSAAWIKRRVAWQAVSDVLSHPEDAQGQAEIMSGHLSKLGRFGRMIYFSYIFNRRQRLSSGDTNRIYNTILLLLCRGE